MTRVLLPCLFALLATQMAQAETATNGFLPATPDGYYLHSYDDCGVEGRQPHVLMQDCYLWTFNTSDTDAGLKERSAVFSYKGIHAVYTNLNPKLSYVLVLTYASDHVYHRVQSLEANGIPLHPPYALPKAIATRVIVSVPPEATRDGKMTLSWKIHGEVNATVSIIELWANALATNGLQIASVAGSLDVLEGKVLDMAYDAVTNARVTVTVPNASGLLVTNTSREGLFNFRREAVEALPQRGEIILSANRNGQEGQARLSSKNLFFDPVHFRPWPAKTAGLDRNTLLLEGMWAINPNPPGNAGERPLNDPDWKPFRVPGQWLQQGYTIPASNVVAVAKEFVIPKGFAGKRIILRFDAIHAGVHYRLNGKELGYSENLFTPVEWDITEAAKPGKTNRLDLAMKTDTVSEAMSYSSGYAFHNLGGVDRSVRVFALPPIHISRMQVNASLDDDYLNGDLRLDLTLTNGNAPAKDLSLALRLEDGRGRAVRHSLPLVPVEAFTGTKPLALAIAVPKPAQWSAEKPNLYRLILELRQGTTVLETIERNIGFRRVDIRDRQFYVNGRRIKLAGACHHEFDPLTGRANTAHHAETDVRLLKEANLNLIRTSHYPPTSELLDAADRLGMYVEVEAPFCWVSGALDSSSNLAATLVPTSAMIDYHHSHPSVIIWSLANESHFNLQFLASARMCKTLDPTRPTTFNQDFAGSPLAMATDIANVHYPGWPFEKAAQGDPRPVYFGEFFFPVCHEQTDVRINPGLRELWGKGCAEPDSGFGRACAQDFETPPLKPGIKPGGWSTIFHSDRLIGGSIWASHDDAFYFSETNHAGYAWHHGFWGLIDYWRRPKPEWFLARHIFSPVWLETRHVALVAGHRTIRVPVENRYAFTDFSELKFDWRINGRKGGIRPALAPGARGELEIPLPHGTESGAKLFLKITGANGTLVDEALVCVGDESQERSAAVPSRSTSGYTEAAASSEGSRKVVAAAAEDSRAPSRRAPPHVGGYKHGMPKWSERGGRIVIEGAGFGLVLDKAKGDFDARDPRHRCAVISFPALHLTRYDFGDLNGPESSPYAVFPDAKTRRVESVEVKEEPAGLRLTVRDRYENFAGSISWLIDKQGRGTVSCDYVYSGQPMDTREYGIRIVLKPNCEELKWRRWSEWGVFPPESISRVEGTASARRDKALGPARWNERPAWPWSLDETELGTADFRSIKYDFYDASLRSPKGSGLTAHANGDAHFRAALSADGVTAHVLRRCGLAQVSIKPQAHLNDEFTVELAGK